MDANQTFINTAEIESTLESTKNPDRASVKDIIQHAKELKGLSPREVATLLNLEDQDLWEEVYTTAHQVKLDIYGNRIVFFAPLYVANYCQNDCVYCGYRRSNQAETRRALTMDELRREVEILEKDGHKRLILVYGEHPKYGVDYMVDTIRTTYDTKTDGGRGEIRRVNINAAPLSVEDYKRVKEAGIGTYQVFQETYHPGRYAELHPANTRKADFAWRLYSLHRAQEAGIDDVAIGALIGLYDWKFEVMGLIYHAIDLDKQFGVGPHTISFPRITPAHNTPFSVNLEHQTTDEQFKRLVATIRLAVPYTGMIMTCREKPEVRKEVIHVGVTQIDAGSRIGVGGYAEAQKELVPDREQFHLNDIRSLDDVVREIAQMGYMPSFCTADYRMGRTGERFMQMAKTGFVKNFCMPNAVLTFQEFLLDYASPETRKVGEELIDKQIPMLPGSRIEPVRERLEEIRAGKRDLFF